MPIYEYVCDECDERFERLVDAGTESVPCPACGARAGRVMSSPGPLPQLSGTPAQNRRRERERHVDREGRRAEFKRRRKAARDARRKQAEGGGS